MSELKMSEKTIEQILNDVDLIIKSGINKLLGDFYDRHKLLEKTHELIINSPSIQNYISEFYIPKVNSTNSDLLTPLNILKTEENEVPIITTIKQMTEELVKNEFANVDKQIVTLQNNYETLTTLCNEILHKINNQTFDLKLLQNQSNNLIQEPCKSECHYPNNISSTKCCDEESLVCSNLLGHDELLLNEPEKENITLQIESAEESEEEDEEEESDEEEAEEEEAEEEEAEEEEEVEEEEAEEQEEEEEAEEQEEEEEAEEEDEEEESDEEEAEDKEEAEEVSDVETEDEEKQTNVNKESSVEDLEEELFEIEIDDITYCTNNEDNGIIYEMTKDGEVGDEIGRFKEGEPIFYADEK